MTYRVLIACLWLSICFHSIAHAGWLDRKAEGWAWYEDRAPKEAGESSNESQKPMTATEMMAESRKQLEESLATAVLNPTQENILAYILIQRRWLDQTSQFSEGWVRLLLDHPELDPTAFDFPVSHYGRGLSRQLKDQEKESYIRRLSQQYGLVFFYNGGDRVSQAFGQIVQQLGKKYDWEVYGVSCDGILLDGYLNNQTDQGMASEFGLTRFPALFAVNPGSNEVVPIAYGLASLDKVEDNLILRFPEEDFGDE